MARQQSDDRQRMKPQLPPVSADPPAALRFSAGSQRLLGALSNSAPARWTRRLLQAGAAGGRTAVVAVPYLWLLLFFVVPFAIVLKISFSEAQIAMPPYQPLLQWAGERLSDIRLNINTGNYR